MEEQNIRVLDDLMRNERAAQYLYSKKDRIEGRERLKKTISFYNRLFVFLCLMAWVHIAILWMNGFTFGQSLLVTGIVGIVYISLGSILIGKKISDAYPVE